MPTRTALTRSEMRLIDQKRVGHLATADARGNPHVVPVCYAYDGDRFYIALDEKPKRVADAQLKRVRNIVERPEVTLTVDKYDEDWSRLQFVLISGSATLLTPKSLEQVAAIVLLRARYPQYRSMRLEVRQVIAIRPANITSWGTEGSRLDTNAAFSSSAGVSEGRGMDFLPLARGRRSVRHYQTRQVDRAAVRNMLEAACWAPSPHGRQPWRFVVLSSPERKAQLADAMGEEWRRILAMDDEPDSVVSTRLRHSRERILQAPTLILACLYLNDLDVYPDAQRQDAEQTMAIQSLGAAIENLLLAAYAQGLDGGWMCAPLFCARVVRDALGLDASLIPHALITLGYAARDPIRRPRRALDEMVSFLD